ncbi:MAG: single-stranded DNA-binding protein [Anaerolineaceae bacterium]
MYQKIIIIGRLGKDPEMRFTPAGQAVTSFSVATDNVHQVDGKPVKDTTWFRVSAWGKLAESCNNFLQKGKMVMVEGRLSTDPKTGGPRIWEGKDDHVAHANFEIMAAAVKFLSAKNEGQAEVNEEPEPSEEIPF